jgi:hypothetical protein
VVIIYSSACLIYGVLEIDNVLKCPEKKIVNCADVSELLAM